VDLDEDEVYRTVVGLFALSYREMRAGTFMSTKEGRESLDTLYRELRPTIGRYSAGNVPLTQEGVHDAVRDAIFETFERIAGEMFRAISSAMAAFGVFCVLLEAKAPTVDVDELLQTLAVKAAALSKDEE
jgi:hypothetical protein